jgi:hypothetical protein
MVGNPEVVSSVLAKTGAQSSIPSSRPTGAEEQRANQFFLAMVTKMVTVTKKKASRFGLAFSYVFY